MTRRTMVIVAMCAVVMALPSTALAGGWATTATVDEAPDGFRAGATHEVTYTVLQHDETPVDDSTAIVFKPAKGTMSSASEIIFRGFSTGRPGQYRAHVELPVSGVWIWEVRQGELGTFQLGSLEVGDSHAGGEPGDEGVRLLTVAFAALALLLLPAARIRQRAVIPNSVPASMITSRT
jgi:hypothetical protein